MKEKKYEYIVRRFSGTLKEIEEQIELLGNIGWRLVTVIGNIYYFERELKE